MQILDVKSISLGFGGLRVLQNVSFTVEKQTITSLVGPNGAGKTSVFNIISRLIKPSAGEVWFEGRRIDILSPDTIAKRGIGRMFQDPRVFSGMTVFQNALSGTRLRANSPWYALVRDPKTQREWQEANERLLRLLEDLGLAAQLNEPAESLSFAEQRFLSFARCLAGQPRLLLLDEPTVGLDRRSVEWFVQKLRYLADSLDLTIVLVEHNMDVVLNYSDQIHLLVQGEVVASGSTAEMRRHARMIEAYLGDRYVATGS